MQTYLTGPTIRPSTNVRGNNAPLPIPLEMVTFIQELLLMHRPDGIPVDELPHLYMQATNETLDPKTFGANGMYEFLRMSCFKKVVDVRKRKSEYFVKGTPLGLSSISLLRHRRSEATRPIAIPMEVENVPQPQAAGINPAIRAVMPAPVFDLPQLVKALETANAEAVDAELKLEKQEKEPKYKPDDQTEAKPKILPSSSAECRASTSTACAAEIQQAEEENVTKKAVTGTAAAAEDRNANTCRALAVFGQISPPPPPGERVVSEKSKATDSGYSGTSGVETSGDAPQAVQTSSSKIATSGTVQNLSDTVNYMMTMTMTMFKEIQEEFKLQHQQTTALTQLVLDTPKSRSRHYREEARNKKRRNENGDTDTEEDKAEPPSPGSPVAAEAKTKVRTYEKYEFFTNGQHFKERAQYYLGKYGKKDRADLAGHSGQNMYVLHVNYLNDPHLTEKEIRGLFPKAVYGMIGPSKNRRTCFLNLLFKRPKYTMAAHKHARKVFGRDIYVAYGRTELIGIGSPRLRVSFVANDDEDEEMN